MRYDFELQYVNTKDFGCVDTLSRLINDEGNEDMVIACTQLEEDMTSILNDQISGFPVTVKMVQQATNKCEQLQKVIKALKSGWETTVEDALLPYYRRRDSLSVVKGCVLYGERVIIPNPLRNRVLHQLHRGHPGKERMKSVARSHVFWPGIDEEIAEFVRNCQPCALAGRSPGKSIPQPWPPATKPMERLHVDIAGPCDGMYYLVMVDAYSKWPEIFDIRNISSSAVIEKVDETFARYGNCDTIVSDNGTQFVSAQFQEFLRKRGVKHARTAPYHPQSNGQAERFVDTLKRALAKLKNEGTSVTNLQTFLQTYRTTPNPNVPNFNTPAEAFLNRKIKTSLDLLNPLYQQEQQNTNSENQNGHDKKLRKLKAGDLVYARVYSQNSGRWVPGTVIERVGSVNYNILLTENQRLIRSHINQLKSRYANEDEDGSTRLLCDSFDLYNLSQQRNSSEVAVDGSSDSEADVQPEVDSPMNDSDSSEDASQPVVETNPRLRRQVRRPAWMSDYVTF